MAKARWMMEPKQVMVWEVYEEGSEEDAVKAWTFYIVKEGESPGLQTKPFAKGYWFFGTEGRDAAGHRLYIEAYLRAKAEVDRLNAQPFVDGK